MKRKPSNILFEYNDGTVRRTIARKSPGHNTAYGGDAMRYMTVTQLPLKAHELQAIALWEAKHKRKF